MAPSVLVSALRPRQWIKNLFLFIPFLFGQKLLVPELFWRALFGFVLFSAMASSVYLMNDLLDYEEDRQHPIKRKRPVASGALSRNEASLAMVLLAGGSMFLAYRLHPTFGHVVAAYAMVNLLYSQVLKKVVILDAFCLGLFFLLRVTAGSVLAEVESSHWMIFMVFLLAVFLGFNKRRQELLLFEGHGMKIRSVLAQYDRYFIDQMIAVLTSSMVVVYMLYTVDAGTIEKFGTTHLLWTIPFVYFGIFRYLYLVHKKNEGADPSRILYTDRAMQVNLLMWVGLCFAIIYCKI